MAYKLDIQPSGPQSNQNSGWAVLIESYSLNFAELNSLNYHSLAWSMVKGKPLIYNQIEQLIQYGFKQFIIGLYHIDQLVRQQIQQLESLYSGCIFKCTQVKDSLFFEQGEGLSPQGEIYLQRYMAVYSAHNLNQHSPKPMYIWIQKIQIDCINPFDYLHIGLTQLNTEIIVKTNMHSNKPDDIYGFWLDINSLAARYKKLSKTHHHLVQGEIIRQCFNQINQRAQQLLINPKDLTASTVQHEEDGIVASRCFNQVTIDTDVGIVMKQSTDIKKLKQEIDFYNNLPDDLKIYFPRFIESKINQKNAWYSLEYYPYKSLSQYFVYYTLPLSDWTHILDRLLNIHQHFVSTPHLQQSQNKIINSHKLYIFYTQKLTDRINSARNNPELNQILSAKSFYLNGQLLQGFTSLYPWLLEQMKQLCQHVDIGFLHGDLCFSNILLEPASGVIRLIDPRGDFMGWVNEGDPRYDLAKLLHSVHGKYDFIINDLFNLEHHHLKFNFHIPESDYLQQLELILFDKIKQQTSYALDDLILLESLLFITMLPLHRDQPKRQIAFLLTGLKLLNQVYESRQQHGKTCCPFTTKAIVGATAPSSTI